MSQSLPWSKLKAFHYSQHLCESRERDAMRLALFRLFFCTLLLSSGVCLAEVFAGRIVGVIDGDTVDVLIDTETLIRVRLSGIDAPERKQAFGSVAKKALSELTFDRRVIIEAQKVDQ